MDAYELINWQNADSTATPVNAENLNHMEQGIEAVTNAVKDLEETGVNQMIDDFAETIAIEGNKLVYLDRNGNKKIIGTLPG